MRINAQKEKTKVLSNVNVFSFSDRSLLGVHLNHFCPYIIFAYEYCDLGSPRKSVSRIDNPFLAIFFA